MKAKGFFIDIRPMSLLDAADVKKLEQECRLAPWTKADYMAEVNRSDSISLVAKIENKVSGFVIARLIKHFDSISTISFYEIEIYNLCVAGKYRGLGIGRSFISEVLKRSKHKVTTIWLEVRESNKKAISFYNSLDFKITGKRKNFYRNPDENGLIMRKNL